jgi:hypothetical protein
MLDNREIVIAAVVTSGVSHRICGTSWIYSEPSTGFAADHGCTVSLSQDLRQIMDVQ